MRYALMIYTEPGYDEGLSDGERAAVLGEYAALFDDVRCVGGGAVGGCGDGHLCAGGRWADADD